MALSLAAAVGVVRNQGKGTTLGRSPRGAVLMVSPGRVTLAEMAAEWAKDRESVSIYGPVVSVDYAE